MVVSTGTCFYTDSSKALDQGSRTQLTQLYWYLITGDMWGVHGPLMGHEPKVWDHYVRLCNTSTCSAFQLCTNHSHRTGLSFLMNVWAAANGISQPNRRWRCDAVLAPRPLSARGCSHNTITLTNSEDEMTLLTCAPKVLRSHLITFLQPSRGWLCYC